MPVQETSQMCLSQCGCYCAFSGKLTLLLLLLLLLLLMPLQMYCAGWQVCSDRPAEPAAC
jgi:hypothetical protein